MAAVLETVKSTLLDLLSNTISYLPALMSAIVVLAITRYSIKPARRLTRVVTEQLTSNFSLQLLAVKVTSVAIWIFGILFACLLIFPGLGLGDVIALLGLSSVAVGFAFQDIFKNFLAGILLLLNQPFQVNDQIIVNDYEGTVETIDIRSTKIRNYQGEIIIIPNSVVFTNSIEVLTQRPNRRTDLSIGLDYNTPLPNARQLLQETASRVEGVLADPEVEVDIVSFGDSSIDFVVRYWTRPTKAVVCKTQTRMIMALKEACDKADLNIPYPIRTMYFFDQQKFADHSPLAQQSAVGSNGSNDETNAFSNVN
ncbi:MAG: mechanosensitive ion channel family protein [Cyanobacteria bacterium J06626_14]